jgi:hypothetical protein
MDKIILVIHKKPLKDKLRSLDLALNYLKDNLELKNNRWITRDNTPIRIGRTSYQQIVLPAIEDINSAFLRYVPNFKAFDIKEEEWREGKYSKSIKRNEHLSIDEDEKHFYLEVTKS